MKVAVVHDTLNPCGGAERLALYAIRALWEAGFSVDLVTVERTSWDRVGAVVGERFRDYIGNEIVLPPLRKLPTIYGRYLEWFLRDVVGFAVKMRRQYDLIVVTKQLAVPVFGDIIYIHFPDFYPGVEALYYPERYVYNTLLRVYALPSHILSRLLINAFRAIDRKPVVLTNSRFVKSLVNRWLGLNAVVVYPPVDVRKYLPLSKNREREDLVVTIGRIERSKGQHIVPYIARNTPQVKYLVLGAAGQMDYLMEIERTIKKLGLEGRVKLFVDIDESTKLKLLSKAKAYLHTMKYEHFGLSVVESMAAGLVPIVHRLSGSWVDIVSGLSVGLRYSYMDYEECASAVLKAVTDWSPELSEKLSLFVTRFAYEGFKDKLLLAVRSVLKG